jgi:ABC-type transport system involved in multi-copper enzyme maturation permease subunit
MIVASLCLLLAQTETHATEPGYFAPVALILLIAGGLAWLVAAVLGFGRARAFGSHVRWFALAAVCLIIYHLQFLLLGIIAVTEFRRGNNDYGMMLNVGAFFNLFIVIGAVCAIMGFVKMKTTGTDATRQNADVSDSD